MIAAAETWTLKKDDRRWIGAFEMRFWPNNSEDIQNNTAYEPHQ